METRTTLFLRVAIITVLLLGLGGSWSYSSADGPVPGQPTNLSASVSPLLQYQGRLTNPGTGQPVANDTYTMTFQIYAASTGGSALWVETKPVSVTGGVFSTVLGNTSPLPQSLFNGQALWLGVAVNTDPEATPRQAILPTAYALSLVPGAVITGSLASPALQVGNGGSGLALYGQGRTLLSGNSAEAPLWVVQNGSGAAGYFNSPSNYAVYGVGGNLSGNYGGYFTGNSGVYGEGSNGYGGYFTSPIGDGLRGMAGGSSGAYGGHFEGWGGVYAQGNNGFAGYFTSSGSSGVVSWGDPSGHYGGEFIGWGGVYGQGIGYGGYFTSTAGPGVSANSASGAGVQGTSTNGYGAAGESTNSVGVWGSSTNSAGVEGLSINGPGVLARSAQSHSIYVDKLPGPGAGIYVDYHATGDAVVITSGQAGASAVNATSASGNSMPTVKATNGGNGAAVWAESLGTSSSSLVAVNSNLTYGHAALFMGNVDVQGTMTKLGGSFKIDHPLDPANRYLQHSFVESPDMKNIYDGVAVLDANGEAVVTLPDWFGALNRDFRYQLTCIGGYAPVYVAKEIQGNAFKIAGGQPGLKVSWQVTGIRQDAWANDNRIPVETDKPLAEQGTYLYPEGFGQPETCRLNYSQLPEKPTAP